VDGFVLVRGWREGDTEAVAELVGRVAAEECPDERCPIAPVLGECVRDSVDRLHGARIPGFVPLLALRRVRCCIRSGTCDCGVC